MSAIDKKLLELKMMPSFFHDGKECIEIEGRIYSKESIAKLIILGVIQ